MRGVVRRLGAAALSVSLAGCSVFGVRSAPEPPYRVVATLGAVEVRQYGPRLAAETTVETGEVEARDVGFRRLAGYIFGDNVPRRKIAMTAPVAQAGAEGRTLAMTAPVAEDRAAGGWTIRFFMPQGYTLETLPRPTDPLVRLVTVPAEDYAVLRFSDGRGPAAVARETKALLASLAGSAWHPDAAPIAWFYDPPWTLPPFRRNEVAVAVAR